MDDSAVISKAEFARRRNVSRARVSQWIDEGKISGAAIVGEGRGALIVETIAIRQLQQKLDIGPRAGNGLDTDLKIGSPAAPIAPQARGDLPLASPAEVSPAPASAPDASPEYDPIEERIKRARLDEIERRNRKSAEEELARRGRFMETAAAIRQFGVIASRVLNVFEGALADYASAISAKWQLPQRDVLHVLRIETRKVRAAAAKSIREVAEDLPELVTIDITAAEAPDAASAVQIDSNPQSDSAAR